MLEEFIWGGADTIVENPVQNLPIQDIEKPLKIAVIWWWPAWASFSIHLLRLSNIIWRRIELTIFEPRWGKKWQDSCKQWCAWILSRRLVDKLKEDDIVSFDGDRYNYKACWIQLNSVWRSVTISRNTLEWWLDRSLLDKAKSLWATIEWYQVDWIKEKKKWKWQIEFNWTRIDDIDLAIVSIWLSVRWKLLASLKEIWYEPPETDVFYNVELVWPTLESIQIIIPDHRDVFYVAVSPKWGNKSTLTMYGNNINNDVLKKILQELVDKKIFSEIPKVICRCRPKAASWSAKKIPNKNWLVFIWDALATRFRKWWIEKAYDDWKLLAEFILTNWYSGEVLKNFILSLVSDHEDENHAWKKIIGFSKIIHNIKILKSIFKDLLIIEKDLSDDEKIFTQFMLDITAWRRDYRDILSRSLKNPKFYLYFLSKIPSLIIYGARYWFK